MKKLKLLFFLFFTSMSLSYGQVLNANGPGNTYELINAFFAPGNNAVESPEQTNGQTIGSHPTFGRHIDEVFDATTNKFVFRFISHLNQDNDISTSSTDRQRVEIKTYAPSPANMKGTLGETVTYKWRFKLPTGFQPSTNFTHLHQIKPVGGDDDDPLFTITARKSTVNRIELRYDQSAASAATNLLTANLSLFENEWVEVTETIFIHPTAGSFTFLIRRISDNLVLMNYTNASILTIRSDNTFIRPKWGIYRSIANAQDLRDEEVLFSDFSVVEGVLSVDEVEVEIFGLKSNLIVDSLEFNFNTNENKEFKIYNSTGVEVKSFQISGSQKYNVEDLAAGTYFLKNSQGNSLKFIKK